MVPAREPVPVRVSILFLAGLQAGMVAAFWMLVLGSYETGAIVVI